MRGDTMHRKTITLIAAVISFSAQAEWSYVGTSSNGSLTAYMDFSTLRKTANGYRVWDLHDYKAPPKMTGALSMSGLNEYDCKQERSRILQETHYSGPMGRGEVLRTISGPSDWSYVIPGSVGESSMEIVCGRKR
jgi:hypothetical protein